MEVESNLTDKIVVNIPGIDPNPIDQKKQNEISQTSPAYIFCKSLEEINNKNENGWSPIYKSVMSNNKLALKELLKLGSDPNIPNNLGETPLYLCIENDNYDLFKVLIENGADPNIQKRNGDTPLHLVIKTNMDKKYLIEILKNNGNPNIQNKLYQQTATHLALKNKFNEDILKCFRKSKADVFNIKDKYDKTPFDYAKELNDDKYIEIINKIFVENKDEESIKSEIKNDVSYNDNKNLNSKEKEKHDLNEDNTKVEKKLIFNNDSMNEEIKEKDNENNNMSKKEENEDESKKINEEENKNIIVKGNDKESYFDSLSKFDNEILSTSKKEDKTVLENDAQLINLIQKKESKDDINKNTIKDNKITEKSENEKIISISKDNNNNKSTDKKSKDKKLNISNITNNTNKEKDSEMKEKEIEIDLNKPKKNFTDEKNSNKDYFNKSESGNSESEFEKLNYKLFKHLKNLSKKKNGVINKETNKTKNKSKKTNNQNNVFYYSIRNNYDTEKDISTIKNENSFSYEAKETINESDINNNISNKENISLNSNLVYHNKNYLATKEKNKTIKERSFLLAPKNVNKRNIYNKQNIFRYSSPDYKFTCRSFNRNNLIPDNQNMLMNKIEISNTNSDIYNQYKNNNIIICKHINSYNKFNYDRNSLNNTTFSSLRNNTGNNIKSLVNRNSLTSNSFTNNTNSNTSFRNNNSVMINDYYNISYNNNNNFKYQINSYKMQKNNLLIKFRDWLISCDLLCYYNTLVKHNMYNIDKYIDDIRFNKINVITFKNIEEFGIRKPGHIYRLLLKLQIDAGKIDNNIYKFIIDRFNANTMTNNGAMTTSVNDIHCFGLNCLLSNNSNNGYNYTNKKMYNGYYNESDMNYYDIFSFLKVNNMWKFKENFIHNGFDQIDFILIQLFSKYSFDKKILNDYMHIYLDEDKNYILKILYKEKKRISNLMGFQYNDDEIKHILSYSQNINSLNESYTNNFQNDNNDCCSIF